MTVRTALVLLSTLGCLGLMVAGFWFQDWRYTLPAAKPIDLQQPGVGEAPTLPAGILPERKAEPVLLHFFNPDCPCSRFNLDHVRDLIRRHGRAVRFVAVLQGEGGSERLKRAFARLGLGIGMVVDEGGEIARATGVYATPQAVLLDSKGRLRFRGNYNSSRYCTDPQTEYARLAIEELLSGKPVRPVDPAAALSYGCPRPARQKVAARL